MLPRARLTERSTNTSTFTLSSNVIPLRHLDTTTENCESEIKKTKCCENIGWDSKWDLYVSVLSFSLDSASWIHLISSCAIHGGAAYLVARIISILLIGVPMLFFELGLGQMSGMGPIKLFGNLRPVFTGVGIFLMISSVYKSIYNTALALWPLSKVMQVLLVDLDIESSNQTTSTAELDWNQQLTQLDALLVISISFIWILVVILIIFEKKFLNKISYITLFVPLLLLIALMGKIIHANPSKLYLGLSALLIPNWEKLLLIPVWSRAIVDTLLSFNLGFGVITFMSSSNSVKMNCLRTSFVLVACHTVVLGVLMVLTSSTNSVTDMSLNRTDITLEIAAARIGHDLSDAWKITFYGAIFVLNINGLIFISNMLATSFSNLRWRPVLVVLIGTGMYVISLPLTTLAREAYQNTIETFTINILPIMGLLLMLAAFVGSLKASSTVDLFEFASKTKLAFRGQSFVFVEYHIFVPFLLMACIIEALVRTTAVGKMMDGMVIVGQLLLVLPWIVMVTTPFCLVAFSFRHLAHTKRWKEICKVSNYEEWLYRRPQSDQASIYELPERVSSSRPVSYYSSATILASDSAMYSYY